MLKYLIVGILGVLGVIAALLYLNSQWGLGINLPSTNWALDKQKRPAPKYIKKIHLQPVDLQKLNLDSYKSASGELVEYEDGAILHLWLQK